MANSAFPLAASRKVPGPLALLKLSKTRPSRWFLFSIWVSGIFEEPSAPSDTVSTRQLTTDCLDRLKNTVYDFCTMKLGSQGLDYILLYLLLAIIFAFINSFTFAKSFYGDRRSSL